MRIIPAAFLLSIGTVAVLTLAVPRFDRGYSEAEVRRELRTATTGDVLDRRIGEAVEDGDVALAAQYAALAGELGRPLKPETIADLERAEGALATLLRGAGDFAGAYITGRADSAAGLAGAVVSDLTVVGDVRDIISEGGKAAVGEEYSEFLLTLAAIGLAAEGATVATGGSSLIVKAALSVLKVAKRTGNLTVEFAQQLIRLARTAAQQADLAADATRPVRPARLPAGVDPPLTRSAARAELTTVLSAVGATAANAGPAEAVRLLRTVNTTADAERLATFTARFGRRSRAVFELTGKISLRAFRAALRGLRLVIAFLWSMLAWLAGLVFIRVGRKIFGWVFNLFRTAFVAVALP